MIQIKISLDNIDYDSMIPIIVPLIVKNKAMAQITILSLKSKIKNKSKSEKDALVAKFLQENKVKVSEFVNKYTVKLGVEADVTNLSFDII